MKRLRKILIISLSAILAFVLVIHPIFAVVLYEAIFSMRYEPSPEYAFTADGFDSLAVERVELVGDGERRYFIEVEVAPRVTAQPHAARA